MGGALIREGLRLVQAGGHGAVIVLGQPAYYSQFGFSAAARWAVRAPWKVPVEAFLAQELIPGYLAGKAGIVRYPAAFGEAP
jgi:predicted N-acetyltransferase YhbS